MTAWVIWRLDARRHLSLWRMRIPQLPTRKRIWVAASSLLAATAVLVWVVGVAALSLSAEVTAESAATAVLAIGLIAVAAQAASAASVGASRAVLADPDLELMQRLPITATQVFTARLLLRGTLPPVVFFAAILVPLAAAATVVFGGGGAVVAGRVVLVLAAGFAAARCLGRAGAMACLRLVLALDKWRGVAVAALTVLQPCAATALIVALGAGLVSGGPGGTLLGGPVRHTASVLVTDGGIAVLVSAVLLAVAVAGVVLLRRLAAPVSLIAARDAFASGMQWRRGRPFSTSLRAALTDKDLRLLARRGPAAWDLLAVSLQLLPGIAAVAVAAAALRHADPSGVAIGVASATVLVGFMAVSQDSLNTLGNTDADGPVLEVLKSRPTSFWALLGARASRQALLTYGLAVLCVLVLGIGAWGALPPWALTGLVVLAAAVSVADATALVVATALFPAILRPAFGTPDPEPQARMATTMALVASVLVAWPMLVALRFVPLPERGWGALVPLAAAVAIGGAVGPVTAALTVAWYRRWVGYGRTGSTEALG